MTTDNTNTTRNDSLAARTDTLVAVVSGLVTRTAGYHQNGGTGADGTGPHQSDIPAEAGMDVSGRAWSLSAVCPRCGGLNLSRHAHIRQPAINRLWGMGELLPSSHIIWPAFPWYEGEYPVCLCSGGTGADVV